MARYAAAERFLADLFRRLGYKVDREVRINGVRVDMVVESPDGLRSPVEIKWCRKPLPMRTVVEIIHLLETTAYGDHLVSPIIVSLSGFSQSAKEVLQGKSNFRFWDESSLRDKAAQHQDLRQRLEGLLLGEPIDQEEGQPPSMVREADFLISQLKQHTLENTLTPSAYEKLCMQVFSHVFSPDLYGFKPQSETTDGANRYDFICRIKHGNTFWDAIRHDFRTKAIVFECKNYNEKITADQVYSTERYLFNGALRTVCFLISRLGPNEGCIRAAQGAMRESGKLVLLLSNQDLIDLLKLGAEIGGAENYLDERIWDFVVSLPR
ncbi:restriction endonuclease [Sinorhizobium meliloti]|uniref:restriction endonuclease n=1 Tax=Rhizobium meliloti TaxID=382 RepID=UPI0013E2F2F5|nr:restriction endonuclease [Sinorhizobium meliloti]